MASSDPKQLNEIMDRISPEEKAVRQACFEAILAKAPAGVDDVSRETGLAPSVVAGALAHLADLGIVVRDKSDAVVGCWGLTLTPSSHRLAMNGHEYFGWCAEDIVGIPAALYADATVSSSCFHCGQEITVEIRRGEVVASLPTEVRLWLAEVQVGRSIVDNA